jgi:DNA adenine methylase
VEIRCQSAFDTIDEFSQDHTVFWYFDPPYYPSTRVSPKVYNHELTAFQHLTLLKKIKEISGHVVLSGYPNPLYDKELADWDREVILIKNCSSYQKEKPLMEEVLWIKPHWPF